MLRWRGLHQWVVPVADPQQISPSDADAALHGNASASLAGSVGFRSEATRPMRGILLLRGWGMCELPGVRSGAWAVPDHAQVRMWLRGGRPNLLP
jgi:hypothetical protein